MDKDNTKVYITKPRTLPRVNSMTETVVEDASANEIMNNWINNIIVKDVPTYYSSKIDNGGDPNAIKVTLA